MRLTIVILTGILALNACTTAGDAPALRDREWQLTWIEGFPSMPAGVTTPTIRFGSDGRLGGNTACNSAGAAYMVDGDRLTIDALITTKRACIDPAGNQLERAYIGAVEGTRRFRIANDTLELLDASGTVVARFR